MKAVKSILIGLFILVSSLNTVSAQLDTLLFGHWELIKIEQEFHTLLPDSRTYQLFIDSVKFKYNLEINWAWANCKIIDNEIILGNPAVTKICCDGRNLTFYKNLNY